jgi:hypothetical protein
MHLCHELYFLQQNLALPECLFDLLLLLLVGELLLAERDLFARDFDEVGVLGRQQGSVCFGEEGALFLFAEGVLRFTLNLFDMGAIQFVLMLFEMQIELRLGLEVLTADITLNQSVRWHRLLQIQCTHLLTP